MNPQIATIISVFSAVVCHGLAKEKGRKIFIWTLLGFIFGPIPIIFLFFSHPVVAEPNETFTERVKYFFEFGLLDNTNNESLTIVTSKIKEKYVEDWGENFEADGMLDDYSTLKYGSKKIWSRDTEADVLKGNNVYVNTLKEWSSISKGVFLPKNLVETWKTEQGTIEISFELNNKNHVITPKYLDDYIDVNILKKINRLLSKSGNKFEMVKPFDQTAFVLWLSKDEKHSLIQRGWGFAW